MGYNNTVVIVYIRDLVFEDAVFVVEFQLSSHNLLCHKFGFHVPNN